MVTNQAASFRAERDAENLSMNWPERLSRAIPT
jgi:hypothetical protein